MHLAERVARAIHPEPTIKKQDCNPGVEQNRAENGKEYGITLIENVETLRHLILGTAARRGVGWGSYHLYLELCLSKLRDDLSDRVPGRLFVGAHID
jgi:hypothetical protein